MGDPTVGRQDRVCARQVDPDQRVGPLRVDAVDGQIERLVTGLGEAVDGPAAIVDADERTKLRDAQVGVVADRADHLEQIAAEAGIGDAVDRRNVDRARVAILAVGIGRGQIDIERPRRIVDVGADLPAVAPPPAGAGTIIELVVAVAAGDAKGQAVVAEIDPQRATIDLLIGAVLAVAALALGPRTVATAPDSGSVDMRRSAIHLQGDLTREEFALIEQSGRISRIGLGARLGEERLGLRPGDIGDEVGVGRYAAAQLMPVRYESASLG